MPDETLRDFHDAKLFRIQQPKRVGGAELEFVAVVHFGALLARACASSAWNFVNFAAHHLHARHVPAEGAGRDLGRVARHADRLVVRLSRRRRRRR